MAYPSKSTPAAATRRFSAPLLTRVDRPVGQQSVPAWALSLLLHTIILGVVSLIIMQIPNGAGHVENRSGGIVLIDVNSESNEYLSEGDVSQNSSPDSSPESLPPPAAEQELIPEVPGTETAINGTTGSGESLAESLPGAEAMIVGPRMTGEIGGSVTTEVFGITGTGSRFVYVIDRSESMAGYEFRPMLAARQALWKSLNSLKPGNQFQIVFYNDGVKVMNQQQRLFFAQDQHLEEAKSFIIRSRPGGGTDHLLALKQAFKFAPDVIFFLTDAEGGFTESELREIGRRNRSAAIINAIEFGERRTGNGSLQAVARNSGGQYIFKNINTLRLNGN